MNQIRSSIVQCNCGEYVFRDSIKNVITKLEGYGYGAQKAGNIADMHNFFQHADHYKRVLNEQSRQS